MKKLLNFLKSKVNIRFTDGEKHCTPETTDDKNTTTNTATSDTAARNYSVRIPSVEQDTAILDALHQNSPQSATALATATGLDVNRLHRRLRDLIARGEVATIGNGPTTQYTTDPVKLACAR